MKKGGLKKLISLSLALLLVLCIVPVEAFAVTETYEWIYLWDKGYSNTRYRCVTTIEGESTKTGNERRVTVNSASSMTNYTNENMEFSWEAGESISNGYSLSFQPSAKVETKWLVDEFNLALSLGYVHSKETSLNMKATAQVPPHHRMAVYETELITTTSFKTLKYFQQQLGSPTYEESSSPPLEFHSTATEKWIDLSGKPEYADCEPDRSKPKQRKRKKRNRSER